MKPSYCVAIEMKAYRAVFSNDSSKCVENHSVWLFKWEANCTYYSKVKLKGHERGPQWKANINLLSSFLGATVFEALLGGTWHVGVFFCLGHILSSIVHKNNDY